MWEDVSSYLRALAKHYVFLLGGVGSVILGTVSTLLNGRLPSSSFWILSLACFLGASFLAWRDQRDALRKTVVELERLRIPKFTKERLEWVREKWNRLDDWQKA